MNAQTAGIAWSIVLHLVLLLGVWSVNAQIQVQEPPLLLDLNILQEKETAAAQEEPAPAPVAVPSPPARPEPEKTKPTPAEKPVVVKPVERKVRTRKKVVSAQQPPEQQKKHEEPARQEESPPAQETVVQPDIAAPTATVHAGQGRTDSAASPGQRGGVYSLKDIEGTLIPLERTEPAYPSSARRRNIEGWVQVQFVVNEHGKPEAIRVLAAEPEGIFESSVIKTVGRWRFRPGTVNGVAVRVLVEQTIRFQLR